MFYKHLILAAVVMMTSPSYGAENEIGLDTDNALPETLISRLANLDSLQQAEEIEAYQADYSKAIEFDSHGLMRPAEYYYKKVYNALGDDPAKDWTRYVHSGYGYACLLQQRGDMEGAVSVISDVLSKVEGYGEFPIYLKSALLSLMAYCQSQLAMPEEAKHYFAKAYEMLVEADGGVGKGSFNMVVTCCNIFDFFMQTGDYDEARKWLTRAEDEFQVYEEHGDSLLIEEYKGHIALYRVRYLWDTGHAREAAAVYDAIPRSRISNPTAISVAAGYLMTVGRYDEAADCYARLDSIYFTADGARMTFENINARYVPRYMAYWKAGRTEEALRLGGTICQAIDSAIVWQKKNDAAELAVIYQTYEKELALREARTETFVHRILLTAALLIILLVVYLFLRARIYNKVMTEKNRVLYDQILALQYVEAEVHEQSHTIPEEQLSPEQQLYRKLCQLMEEQEPFTSEMLNRDALARMLNTNTVYLEKAIHTCASGMTTGDFINHYRLERVAHLLKTTDDPINIIGELSGIPSRATLARLFRNAYGMSCREFRQVAKAEART